MINSAPAFRNYKIDFLRGVSILAVMILHFNIAYGLSQSALNKILSVNFINAVASNGNYGVTVFFVISGFLITATTIERYGKLSSVNALNFYILRFARIMPCLLLLLGIIVLFNLMPLPIFKNDPHSTSLFVAIFSVLTFWHNFLMEKIGYFNYCLNILWSLSVEEIFYFTFPVVCLLAKKTRFIIPFWAALIIAAPIFRSFYTNNEIVALYGYFSCFDAIAMGCCAAIIARKMRVAGWINKSMQYGAMLLMASIYVYAGIMQNVTFGISFMALGAAIFMIAAYKKPMPPQNISLWKKSIQWFGANSYELYLFHIVILALMKEIYSRDALGDYSKLLWLGVFLSASALISGAIAKYYSQPMNQKIRRRCLKKSPANI
jgi:peptidoglycan/LPS O-acetylase OafA/YrhL